MSSFLGTVSPQTSVVCTSSWQCDRELSSVLRVSLSDNTFVDDENLTRENCVILEPKPSSDLRSSCEVVLCCDPQGKDRFLSINVCSHARTMEVYSLTKEGKEEEYMGTSRGEKTYTVAGAEGDSPVTLYETFLKFDFPLTSCKIKMLSLGGKQCLILSRISLQISSVPEGCTQASSNVGSSINLERVQSMMDSMGGKLSPGAEQLMNMVRAQQKHQVPFGAHFLQMFGNFGSLMSKERKHEESKVSSIVASNSPSENIETLKTKILELPTMPQNTMQPANEVRSTISSLLQSQLNCAGGGSHESLMPLLRSLCLERNNCILKPREDKQESFSETRDEKMEPLESNDFWMYEEDGENSLKPIDDKMNSLTAHLDSDWIC
ncbi:hypothetical protein GDO86_013546 [Hymenochirus boettgeri]|uniref:Uncharacterized protein n=1 Tax=Hymenochirus boettgeri TaxID=247094 RepID=A0A8T2IRU8_9PIPI|nr:hypothetical protein GDO86_013546 [Hymenochirus boettgeri]